MSTGELPDRGSPAVGPQRQLELLERLARATAHDLNTQLTAILGFADLTAADPALPEALRADVQQISAAAHRAGGLTARLQSHCPTEPPGARVVDLDEVVAASRPARERLAGGQLELVDEPAPALTLVEVDPAQLQWFLLDAVVDAREALPGGGRLTFATAHDDGRAKLTISGAGEPIVLSLPFATA